MTITVGSHPRRGMHDPTVTTSRRVPGSVRRTTTIDSLRPAGVDGPLVLTGRGRDLYRLAALTGTSVASGFRAAVRRVDPDPPVEDSLLHLLSDDLPVVPLVSGHAVDAEPTADRARPQPAARSDVIRDRCAGFVDHPNDTLRALEDVAHLLRLAAR